MADDAAFEPDIPERFNLAHYLLDARIEEGRGDRVAIHDAGTGRDLSYAWVQRESNRLAWVLRDLGIGMEDRVLIALPDGAEFAAAFFATLKLGAVVVMVNTELPVDDYAYYLDYTRAKALVTHTDLALRAGAVIRGARFLRACLVAGPEAGGFLSYEARVNVAPAHFTNADTGRDDFAIWLFTSGSTGKPKAAVHMHHDFAYNIEGYAKRVLGLRESDVTIGVPKLFFGYATGTNLMFPFAVGASTVLFPDKATPERLFELILRHRPTFLTTVPTMINKMLSHESASGQDLSSLRVCVSAGEALPPDLYDRWKARFGVEILDGIGSAELFHIYISNYPGDVRAGCLGRLVPGYQARVARPDGTDAPDGEIGTLWVKGDSAAVYYFGAHEKSKEVLRGDWVVSGDLFRREPGGYFYYEGRADDMLKVGGIFVSPLEVENTLLQHAAVQECCVVGYEDEAGLVKPKACVVPKPGRVPGEALWTELADFLRGKLAHYKVPRRWEARAALPRNDRGKVLRRELR